MTKLQFLLISSTFIIITTLYVNSLGLSDTENPVDTLPGEVDNSVDGVLDVLRTFIDLMSFRLDGVPALFNIIFVIIAIGFLYVLVDTLKDLVPFT